MANRNFDLYFDVVQTLERLGIEYVIIGAFAGTSPRLFGRNFHLVAAGNRYGLPDFYELHLWLWHSVHCSRLLLIMSLRWKTKNRHPLLWWYYQYRQSPYERCWERLLRRYANSRRRRHHPFQSCY
jgi:hypothetical protein